MRRFLHCLFAFLLVFGATGAEVRPEAEAMDCGVPVGAACPCGMPMPERPPRPCGTAMPFPAAVPTRAFRAAMEYAPAADRTVGEPKPWPGPWAHAAGFEAGRWVDSGPIQMDAGPPLLASERTARLRVFRI